MDLRRVCEDDGSTACRVHPSSSLRALHKPNPLWVRLEVCAMGNSVLSAEPQYFGTTPTAFRVLHSENYPFHDLATCSMLYSLENKTE
jgi:hypothetical protein